VFACAKHLFFLQILVFFESVGTFHPFFLLLPVKKSHTFTSWGFHAPSRTFRHDCYAGFAPLHEGCYPSSLLPPGRMPNIGRVQFAPQAADILMKGLMNTVNI